MDHDEILEILKNSAYRNMVSHLMSIEEDNQHEITLKHDKTGQEIILTIYGDPLTEDWMIQDEIGREIEFPQNIPLVVGINVYLDRYYPNK